MTSRQIYKRYCYAGIYQALFQKRLVPDVVRSDRINPLADECRVNFAAKDYPAFCINLLYVVCLLTLGGAAFRQEKDILQGMIGALMMISAISLYPKRLITIPEMSIVTA